MRTRRTAPKAFTLVELLVVIGIIALLIAILLPSLNAARRAANTTKCLSAQRQIGLAYFMYSHDNKGFFPVAVHATGSHMPVPEERRWYTLVGNYVVTIQMNQITDVARDRNSVIWGCPEWSNEIDPASTTQVLRPGYGMNYYPTYFEDFNLRNLAYILGPNGRYVPQNKWTKASERGLLADAVTHILATPATMSPAGRWQPYDPVAAGAFYVDASRHGRKGLSKRQSFDTPCINMLFCDGHASTVSVKDAWNAIHNPGEDRTTP